MPCAYFVAWKTTESPLFCERGAAAKKSPFLVNQKPGPKATNYQAALWHLPRRAICGCAFKGKQRRLCFMRHFRVSSLRLDAGRLKGSRLTLLQPPPIFLLLLEAHCWSPDVSGRRDQSRALVKYTIFFSFKKNPTTYCQN